MLTKQQAMPLLKWYVAKYMPDFDINWDLTEAKFEDTRNCGYPEGFILYFGDIGFTLTIEQLLNGVWRSVFDDRDIPEAPKERKSR